MNAPANLSPIWAEPMAQGWSCFPIPRGEKAAKVKWERWQAERPDPATVAGWASRESNIAIVTGAISGLLVLDLDSADAVAEAEALGLPDTIRATTAKGQHVYFRHPGGNIRNRAGIKPGWDIRCDGGYVVGPGSLHPSGAEYSWHHPPGLFDLADPPQWLLDLIAKPANGKADAGGNHPYAMAALDCECEAIRNAPCGAQESTLNAAAFKIGHYIGGRCLDHQTARNRLLSAALAMPSHDPRNPWTVEGLSDKIDRALRDGMAEPKTPPERMQFAPTPRHDPQTGEIHDDAPASDAKLKARGNGETSEDQIALAFARRHGDRLRFDHSAGRWYEWTGNRWQRNETKLAFHFARELARESSEGAKGFCKASVASGVEAFARADPQLAVTADAWDRDPWLLGTPGGTVDLRTGQLQAARQADLITKQTGTAPEPGEPRRWLQFLSEATAGDRDLMRFLQQVAGYCLTGSTREHALFFIHGPGGNGKSVFLNLLNYVLGDYATTAGMETFTASKHDRHPTDLAMLNGARLVSASETEEGRAWAESRIKQVTGGDKISARFMRQDFFEFVPQFKLVIVGNHAPVLGNVDEAARRRFNIIPFTQKPVTPDRELEDKLKAEAGQILAWAIAGCLDWQANGLVRPEIVTAATADYFEDQDLFGQWIEDRCERDPGKWEMPTPLYNDWADYARAAGDDPGTQRAMSSKLKRAGFAPRKMPGGIRTYQGLSLKKNGGFNGTGY